MDNIPYEIFLQITQNLNTQELTQLSQISKSYNFLCYDDLNRRKDNYYNEKIRENYTKNEELYICNISLFFLSCQKVFNNDEFLKYELFWSYLKTLVFKTINVSNISIFKLKKEVVVMIILSDMFYSNITELFVKHSSMFYKYLCLIIKRIIQIYSEYYFEYPFIILTDSIFESYIELKEYLNLVKFYSKSKNIQILSNKKLDQLTTSMYIDINKIFLSNKCIKTY